MKIKKIVIVALLLFCVPNLIASPKVSLSLENSFLTGAINVKSELPEEIVDVTKSVKGGQSFLVLRCKFFNIISLGFGSGVSVSKLNFQYEEWGFFSIRAIDDSLPMFYIPFFGELRAYLPILDDLLSIHGGAKIGGSTSPLKVDYYGTDVSFGGGFFLEPSLGVSLNVRRFLLDFGGGYRLQRSALIGTGGDLAGKYPLDLHQFVLKLGLGVRFGKLN